MRVERPEDIPYDAVPVLVDGAWPTSCVEDAAILSRLDGLASVEEIASDAGARPSNVRAMMYRLSWLGAVELHECLTVEDEEIVEVVEAAPHDPLPLTRRRPPAPAARYVADASPLVAAVLAELARLHAD